MKTTLELPEALGFISQFKNEYAEVFISRERDTILCCLSADYVPIAPFKELFLKISTLVEMGGFDKFIFDKRSLRTFHQPSMEWYFIEWKLSMLDLGLTKHRKILPDLDWFTKAVELARQPLLDRFPKSARERIDIQYCDSIEQALEL